MDGEPEPDREVTRAPTEADLVLKMKQSPRLKDSADRSFLQQLIHARRRA